MAHTKRMKQPLFPLSRVITSHDRGNLQRYKLTMSGPWHIRMRHSDRDSPQQVQLVEEMASPKNHGGQGILGNRDGQTGFFA